MHPETARLLSNAHIVELYAEAAANRLAAEARMARVESPCRAEAAGRRPRIELPHVDCSWIERLWAMVRRAMPVRTA